MIIIAIQVSSEILEGMVLALLEEQDHYGYSITQAIKEILPISDSTMYPILRRLKKEDWVTTYDKPYDGRNRRYYQITLTGAQQLQKIIKDWQHQEKLINKIFKLKGAAPDEN